MQFRSKGTRLMTRENITQLNFEDVVSGSDGIQKLVLSVLAVSENPWLCSLKDPFLQVYSQMSGKLLMSYQFTRTGSGGHDQILIDTTRYPWLSVLVRLREKAIINELLQRFLSNELTSCWQFGFLPKHAFGSAPPGTACFYDYLPP